MQTQEYILIHPLRKSRTAAGTPDPIRVIGSSSTNAAEQAFLQLSQGMPTAHLDGYGKVKFRFSIVKAKNSGFDAKDYSLHQWLDFEGIRTKNSQGMIDTSVRRYDQDQSNNETFVITLPNHSEASNSRKQSGGHEIALYPWEYCKPFYWSYDPMIQYCWDYWPLVYNYWPATIPLPGLYAYPYATPFCYECSPVLI